MLSTNRNISRSVYQSLPGFCCPIVVMCSYCYVSWKAIYAGKHKSNKHSNTSFENNYSFTPVLFVHWSGSNNDISTQAYLLKTNIKDCFLYFMSHNMLAVTVYCKQPYRVFKHSSIRVVWQILKVGGWVTVIKNAAFAIHCWQRIFCCLEN